MSSDFFPEVASDFPFPSTRVIELKSTDSISKGLQTLLDNKILSVPVYDTKDKKYLGWFNISDIIPVFLALDKHIKKLPTEELNKTNVIDVAKSFPLHHKGNDFLMGSESTLKECFERKLSPLFPWVPFYEDSPLNEVIGSLTHSNVKRVPILSRKTNKVVKIISQSLIIQFVDDKIKQKIKKGEEVKLQEVFNLTAEHLGLLKKVVAVPESLPVSEALEVMVKTKHSAIGILFSEGTMLTCVTSKDLLKFQSLERIALTRLRVERDIRDYNDSLEKKTDIDKESVGQLEEAHVALVDYTVTDFVRDTRLGETKARAAIITVRKTDTLRKIIAKMSKTKVHRVFIVDEKKHPIGVASVRDIVSILFPKKKS